MAAARVLRGGSWVSIAVLLPLGEPRQDRAGLPLRPTSASAFRGLYPRPSLPFFGREIMASSGEGKMPRRSGQRAQAVAARKPHERHGR
jgi:hypothetical protein